MKKKFLIFGGRNFYASGGANDLISTIPQTEDEAIDYARSLIGRKYTTERWILPDGHHTVDITVQWSQVFDLEKCEIIFRAGSVFGDESEILMVE